MSQIKSVKLVKCDICGDYHPLEETEVAKITITKGKDCDFRVVPKIDCAVTTTDPSMKIPESLSAPKKEEQSFKFEEKKTPTQKSIRDMTPEEKARMTEEEKKEYLSDIIGTAGSANPKKIPPLNQPKGSGIFVEPGHNVDGKGEDTITRVV